MPTRTTYKALNDRAAAYVATLPADDPLVRANDLIDRANAAIDSGDVELAGELFARVDELLA